MANPVELIFSQFNEECLLIRFDTQEDKALKSELKKLLNILEHPPRGVQEVVAGLDTLCVFYDPLIIEKQILQLEIFKLSVQNEYSQVLPNHWQIPVCYDPQFGIDLELIGKNASLEINEVVQIHSSTIYEVLILGFLPGFAYLGNVPEVIKMARKANPRQHVNAGSIAIADNMTGIYGAASPGGWHIIGRTPLSTFDVNQNPPNFLKQGDTVEFQPVSLVEYEAILKNNSDGH